MNSTPKNSPLASPRETKAVLDDFGLSAKKSLGQNFLVDDNVVGKIIELAQLTSESLVLEVGPGIGTLTLALLANSAGVVSIERDPDLPQVLAETTAFHSESFRLIQGDALKVSQEQISEAFADLIAKKNLGQLSPAPQTFVANLPYAVAATVVLDYFERFETLQSATVMVQKEVADRIAAAPGNKDYGAYTVCLRLIAGVAGRFNVAPSSFMPAPHVESSVVRLERRPLLNDQGNPISDQLRRAASLAAKAAFSQRRKTIRNSMGTFLGQKGLSKEGLDAVLSEADISPTVRGEKLDIPDYLRLGNALLHREELSGLL